MRAVQNRLHLINVLTKGCMQQLLKFVGQLLLTWVHGSGSQYGIIVIIHLNGNVRMYAKVTDQNVQLRHPQEHAKIVAKHGPIVQWGYDFWMTLSDKAPVAGIAPPVGLSDEREIEYWQRHQQYGGRLVAHTSNNKSVYTDVDFGSLIGNVNLWPLELVGPDPNLLNQERQGWPVVWMFDAKDPQFPGWSAWHVAMIGSTTYRNTPTQMVAQLVRGAASKTVLELPSDPSVLVEGGAAFSLASIMGGTTTSVQKELNKSYPVQASHMNFIYAALNEAVTGKVIKGWNTFGPGTPEMDAWMARHCTTSHLNIGVVEVAGGEAFDPAHRFHGVGQFDGTDAERQQLRDLKDDATQKSPAVISGLDLMTVFTQAQDPNLLNSQALYRQVLPLIARGSSVDDAIQLVTQPATPKAPKF